MTLMFTKQDHPSDPEYSVVNTNIHPSSTSFVPDPSEVKAADLSGVGDSGYTQIDQVSVTRSERRLAREEK